MTKRMLIDGTHPEEIRVVITSGNRLEEYDVETSTKTQLKGNIYLAKVTRVEPSLQAAFVDYGGNRHGFLAFNEIHPDYYQIPVEDREALKRDVAQFEANASAAQAHIDEIDDDVGETTEDKGDTGSIQNGQHSIAKEEIFSDQISDGTEEEPAKKNSTKEDDSLEQGIGLNENEEDKVEEDNQTPSEKGDAADENEINTLDTAKEEEDQAEKGSDNIRKSERRENPMRRYKIQEVIKRRQILLIQVVKEERGNKGAALTTYLSLAGRY
ncbi:MAG: ribonuclease E/G, partial [Alphaproteobacteria bacterium]